jgi:hypothetical protein
MFQTKLVEKIKTHFFSYKLSFRKSCHILENVENYVGVGHATDDNMIGPFALHTE